MMESQSNWRKRTILFFASQCITLFGSQIAESNSASAADPIGDMLGMLSNVSFEKGMAGVDLSNGLGLDDIAGFAGAILGGKK